MLLIDTFCIRQWIVNSASTVLKQFVVQPVLSVWKKDNKKQKEKYSNSPVTESISTALAAQVIDYLQVYKSYLDPQLSLPALAEQLSISSHILSQVINETIGTGFFNLINQYRLDEVKTRLKNKEHKTVLQIAMDSGFNSKTSFYTFFKKQEGMTPGQWRKQQGLC